MQFSPQANDRISIDSVDYTFSEHPGLPPGSGFPYGQEGRAATVYQIVDRSGRPQALKVMKPYYQKASLVGQAEQLAPFAKLSGLSVCRRTVFTDQSHRKLLKNYPGLQFGVLMPWMSGVTWFEIVQQRQPLTKHQSIALVEQFLDIMLNLESHQIAHGDLSGGNMIIDGLDNGRVRVELVDIEQLYEPSLPRPVAVMGGSPGYAHHQSGDGLWQVDMDRFAGAILVVEMLSWCDPAVLVAAGDEAFFDQTELQQNGGRYYLLRESLENHWGSGILELFDRAWQSKQLDECPSFSEWRIALRGCLRSEAPVTMEPGNQRALTVDTIGSLIDVVEPSERIVPAQSPLMGWESLDLDVEAIGQEHEIDASSVPVVKAIVGRKRMDIDLTKPMVTTTSALAQNESGAINESDSADQASETPPVEERDSAARGLRGLWSRLRRSNQRSENGQSN